MKLATLCYVQRPGQTLMLHRVKKANDYHEGKWNGLGGKVEPGETPEECAQREVYEESGLLCLDPILRGQITFPQFDGKDDWYVWLFVVPQWEGELIDSPEGTLAWVDNERIQELNLWPGDRIFIPWLFQKRFFSAKFVYEAGEFQGHETIFYGPNGQIERMRYRHSPEDAPPAPDSDRHSSDGRTSSLSSDLQSDFQPVYRPADDTYCWLCGGEVSKRHCKIICQLCGFTRDCSDP